MRPTARAPVGDAALAYDDGLLTVACSHAIAGRRSIGSIVVHPGDEGVNVVVASGAEPGCPCGRIIGLGGEVYRVGRVRVGAPVPAPVGPPVVLRVYLSWDRYEAGVRVVDTSGIRPVAADQAHIVRPVPVRAWVLVGGARHL